MHNGNLVELEVESDGKEKRETISGDYVFSTMPVKDLILSMKGDVPEEARAVARGLIYRDFITVGLLLERMSVQEGKNGFARSLLKDNWIYIQEPDVKVGRLQIFNNWSPYLVKDPKNAWIGLEYFCNEGDDVWAMPDEAFVSFAVDEVAKIGLVEKAAVLDATVIRTKKTYPAYFGSFDRFHIIRDFVDRIENLFLIGRNGMHRYNNQDHSMLTAMTAVDNICNGVKSKNNVWSVNTEQEYHESK
jgi:protoporphyrinogen oxidase